MEEMTLVQKFLLYSSMVFSDSSFEFYNHFFNYWGVAALIGVCGLMYFGVRGMGLWPKIITCALGVALMLTGAVAMHAQLSQPLRASPYWLKRMNEGGGVILVYPPRKVPSKEIVEFLVDEGETSRFYWTPLTPQLEESLDMTMKEYVKRKGQGNMVLRYEKSLNPEDQMRFYYLPPEAPPPKDGPAPSPGAPNIEEVPGQET
jgi:hypothetical protein